MPSNYLVKKSRKNSGTFQSCIFCPWCVKCIYFVCRYSTNINSSVINNISLCKNIVGKYVYLELPVLARGFGGGSLHPEFDIRAKFPAKITGASCQHKVILPHETYVTNISNVHILPGTLCQQLNALAQILCLESILGCPNLTRP